MEARIGSEQYKFHRAADHDQGIRHPAAAAIDLFNH